MYVYIENKSFGGKLKKGIITLTELDSCNKSEIDILREWLSQAKYGVPAKEYKRDIRFVGRFKKGTLKGAFPITFGFDNVKIHFDECLFEVE